MLFNKYFLQKDIVSVLDQHIVDIQFRPGAHSI